jgi:large subunit ribosomal protein L21e
MPSIGCIVKEFAPGVKVDISINSFTHKGRPSLRFQGYNGRVIERRGNSYLVEIKEGNKKKQVIVSPIHLK